MYSSPGGARGRLAGSGASRRACCTATTAPYLVGFLIRLRSEEQLMRETFGEDWERYRKRVPALLPFGRGL